MIGLISLMISQARSGRNPVGGMTGLISLMISLISLKKNLA
jgi:hypothetical protein